MVRWDPDGPGPQAAVLVIAGNFGLAGTALANRIAVYDPATATFAPLGSGMDQDVWCLAAGAQGELYAGGQFSAAGGIAAAGVARWSGLNWVPLGAGVGGATPTHVYALAVLPNGALVTGGDFASAGGQSLPWIAQWNGLAWSGLGSGVDGPVYALAATANGELLGGGGFAQAGGQPAAAAARWNGASWSSLGGGPGGIVFGIVEAPGGDVFAVGQRVVGPATGLVYRWNGVLWSSPGGGLTAGASTPAAAYAVAIAGNGDVCVGGDFVVGQSPFPQFRNVARWNGSSWVGLDGGFTFALVDWPGLGLVAGGAGSTPGGGSGIAAHTGSTWQPLGRGTDAQVRAVCQRRSGATILAGDFVTCDGVAALGIASRQNGVTTALGGGVRNSNNNSPASVRAVLELANGDLVVGGSFDLAGGGAAANIARWNGTSWSPYGAGLGVVTALAQLASSELVATGGAFGAVVRWNGTQWQPLAAPFPGAVRALFARSNGELVAAGDFVGANGMARIARWNGTAWQALAGGLDDAVHALAELPDGSLLAAGDCQFAGATFTGRVARWDGSAWGSYPAGTSLVSQPNLTVRAMAVQPDGGVMLGGDFTWPAARLAAISGSGNPPALVGCAFNGSPLQGTVLALAADDSGSVAVGGDFVGASSGSVHHGSLEPLFQANATSYGAGCAGSAGPVTLAAASLPWVGGTCRVQSTGLASGSLVVDVLSFTPTNVPLSAVLPQALPGCALLASADFLRVVVPSSGVALSQFQVPPAFVFLGVPLRQQHVVLELGAAGIQAVAATNGLTLVAQPL